MNSSTGTPFLKILTVGRLRTPNCEANEEDGRVFIDAIRAIKPGQELAYDYNLVLEERHTPKLKREHPCHCGARKCRHTLLGSKR